MSSACGPTPGRKLEAPIAPGIFPGVRAGIPSTLIVAWAVAMPHGADAEPATRAEAAVEAAARADRRLRAHPDKLRFRHHIERQLRRWDRARRIARGTRWERAAARGKVRGLALLAHWSGLRSDARRARRAEAWFRDRWPEGPPTGDRTAPGPVERATAERVPSASTRRDAGPETLRKARSIPDPVPVPAPASPPAAEARAEPAADSVSASAAELFRVQTIVIDPGHGGEEEGARGPDGLLEKDVNLAIAKRIKRQLQGSFRILLTREDDRTLSLAERSRFANEAEADLFVSIHANGHTQRRFHGIETYVLAVDAPRYGPRLRHREALHAATVGSDADPALRQDLRVLLADLAMRGATAQSRMLAERVQARLVNRLRDSYDDVVDLGVKSALFYVLLGTRMPSILVETGFLTHPEEGARLGTRKYRRQVAVAVAEAIREHVGHREMWAERAATGAYVALP